MEDCIFCKIIKGEAPSSKVYEDESVFVFNSKYPEAETHIIVIPKKHVTTFLDLKDGFDKLIQVTQKIVRDKNIESGYKLVVNGGKYQLIPHFHLHILAGKLENEDDVLNKI